MKNFAVLALLLFASLAVFSQNNLEEVVYLKNGSIIRGVIIEQIPGVSLKIQTKDRNVFSFQMSEIEKMTKEPIPVDKPVKKEKPKFSMDSVRTKGYCGIYEFGGLFGFAGNNISKDKNFLGDSRFKFSQPYFTIKTVQGYHLSRKLFLGAGTGMDFTKGYQKTFLYAGDWKRIIVPVFMEVRGVFTKKKIAPFISQQTGYAMIFSHTSWSGWSEQFAGGVQSETKVGFRLMLDKRTSFVFSAGYRMQHFSTKYSVIGDVFVNQYNGYSLTPVSNNGETYITDYWVHTFLHFVSVKAGFSF